jgi:hypothetical protein
LATIDFDSDSIVGLNGVSDSWNGIQRGYDAGNLTFVANQWNGKINNGEFQVFGTYFETA